MTASRAPMDAGRLRDLVEAFGASPARWPEAERAAALEWIEGHPQLARSVLAPAEALDDLLYAWRPEAPGPAFSARVLDSAVEQVRRGRRRSLMLTLGGGVGLAAACLAGILAAPALVSLDRLGAEPPAVAPPAAFAQVSTDEEVLSEVLAGWEAPVGDTSDSPS